MEAVAEIFMSREVGVITRSLDPSAVVIVSIGAEAPGSVAAGCEGGGEAIPPPKHVGPTTIKELYSIYHKYHYF